MEKVARRNGVEVEDRGDSAEEEGQGSVVESGLGFDQGSKGYRELKKLKKAEAQGRVVNAPTEEPESTNQQPEETISPRLKKSTRKKKKKVCARRICFKKGDKY